MRTTLDIEDDVLLAAKEIARGRGTTAGAVVSELLRKALQAPEGAKRMRNGVPLLRQRRGGTVMTLEFVNRLRDEP